VRSFGSGSGGLCKTPAKLGERGFMSYPLPMATDSALSLIDAEIAKLTQVRFLLAHAGKIATKITAIKTKIKQRKARKAAAGTVAKAPAKTAAKTVRKVPAKARKHRVLSPEARKRIADAQRKRWAAQRAKA
jgi:hypothetical protein